MIHKSQPCKFYLSFVLDIKGNTVLLDGAKVQPTRYIFYPYTSGKPAPLEFHEITIKCHLAQGVYVCMFVCVRCDERDLQTAETCSYLNMGGVQASNHNGCSMRWVWSDDGFDRGCRCCCIADVMSDGDV